MPEALDEVPLRRVVVIGLGVTGRAVARALRQRGVEVVAADDHPSDALTAAAASLGVELLVAPSEQDLAGALAGADALLPSPGVPDRHAAFVVADRLGVPVLSEFDLAARWDDRPVVAVTGTDGKTTVTIEQTADKAILNWETFNVGRNTTVDFKQDAAWSALNRINDPNARPSQIQGQIKADGTVFLINRNSVVFNGTSQVNVKNLAASAVNINDAQFRNGLYSQAQGKDFIPTFANDLASTASSFRYGAASAGVTVEQIGFVDVQHVGDGHEHTFAQPVSHGPPLSVRPE